MNFSFYIAKRYLFSKNKNNAIHIITLISFFGVFVGAFALFLVLSVFSGLKSFSGNFMQFTDPDIRISPKKGKSFFLNDSLKNTLENTKNIIAYSQIIKEKAFFSYKNKQVVAMIQGVDSNYQKVIPVDTLLFSGSWLNTNLRQTVLSSHISDQLKLSGFNYEAILHLYVPKSGKGYITNLKNAFSTIKTQIVGFFAPKQNDQKNIAFISLHQAQKLLHYQKDQISAIDIKTTPKNKAKTIDFLKEQLKDPFIIRSREELNATFYKILNAEKFIAYLIFTLVIVIALFNVVGAMVMMIIEKKDNLKTLHNLGAPLHSLKKIFIFQGGLLCFWACFLGLGLGVFLIFLQQKFHLFYITNFVPYPIEFDFMNFLWVFLTINFLGFVASKIACNNIKI